MNAERTGALATGVGVGLLALMLTWLTANRLATVLWTESSAALIAGITALITGAAVAVIAAQRLGQRLNDASKTTSIDAETSRT